MKAIFSVLILIIFVLSGYILFVFYKNANAKNVATNNVNASFYKEKQIPEVKLQNIENSIWTSDIDINSSLVNFQYPSNGIQLSIDVKKEDELRTDYTKILIKNLDDYKFFSLHEILRQRHIEFSYYKDNDDLSLVVFMPNKDEREKMLNDFEYYKIEYELIFKK